MSSEQEPNGTRTVNTTIRIDGVAPARVIEAFLRDDDLTAWWHVSRSLVYERQQRSSFGDGRWHRLEEGVEMPPVLCTSWLGYGACFVSVQVRSWVPARPSAGGVPSSRPLAWAACAGRFGIRGSRNAAT